jgi:hypothetical protein
LLLASLARKCIKGDAMAFRVAPFYNLHAGVGPNQLNITEDVMLVKFFLEALIIRSDWEAWKVGSINQEPFGGLGLMSEQDHPLKYIDGKYSPRLENWIRYFQRAANRINHGPVEVNGIVSSDTSMKDGAFIPAKYNTLAAMNRILHLANKEKFYNLTDDIRVPAALKARLVSVTVGAW